MTEFGIETAWWGSQHKSNEIQSINNKVTDKFHLILGYVFTWIETGELILGKIRGSVSS